MKTKKLVMPLFICIILFTACLNNPGKKGLNSDIGDQKDWQTYTNTKYHFTIRFPTTWRIIELPTLEYPNIKDQIWLISDALPQPQTGSRPDITLIFSKEDPFPIWDQQYFDDYESDSFWLGDIQAWKVSGINKEGQFSEIVVLANIGDYYLQALPNQGAESLAYFDRVISSLQVDESKSRTPRSSTTNDFNSLDEFSIEFEGISFTYPASLAEEAGARLIPGFVDPEGFMHHDVPEHVRFEFTNPYSTRAPFVGLQPGLLPWLSHQNPEKLEIRPQIFIFPTKEYAEISPPAAERINALKRLLESAALTGRDELPVLPLTNSAQDLRGQVVPLAFQGGRGLRFIAHYSQGVALITNPTVFYTFQGLSDDGSLYVAAFFPLYISLLPDQVQVEDWDDFNRQYRDYMAGVTSQLEGLEPVEFQPDLASLDALIRSLNVSEPD